ncbi:MAG: threonine aldolase family protein [Solirubrobacteraceae bacterium]
MSARRGFASDNSATVHPDVLTALARVNEGHAFGYGHDDYSQWIQQLIAEQFAPLAKAFLVWGGTGANVLCLRAACRPWEAVICAQTSHLNVDECGAPEAIAGVKLLTVASDDGKLTPELVESRIVGVGDEHAVQARLVSVSQCTELGTVYSVEELRALAEHAHGRGLLLHVDGARLTNAAAALQVPLRAVTGDVGVDLLSFGGTKTGLLGAEAVVFLEPRLAENFEYLRKQSMQLASKMRFLAAQFEALLTNELWRRCASHANAMARKLAEAVGEESGVTITRAVQANSVFARINPAATLTLQERFPFYVWDARAGEVRWMCSWDTTEDDVEQFAQAIRETLSE